MKCVGPPGGDPCGADLDPGNKFCPNCGTSVKLSTIVECESRTVCTNIIDGRECGATLLPTHNFCPGCGEKKTNGNFRVEKVQGTEINQPTVEVEVMPKRTSDSETPSRPKKIKVDEELHVDMSQVKYPPSMQNKDENMAEEHHHHLRPGCSANDSSQVSGISSGSSKAPVTSSDSRQAPGTPSGSSDEPGKSSGSPLTTGTPSGASQEPGTSNGSSQVTGTSSGSSQATCTPSGLSQTPVTSSDSRQGPGTSSDSSQEPGTSGGSSQVTGISSGSSQEPGKPSGSSQEPGTSGGSLHEPGTSGGSLQEPGTSSGSSQTTGRSVSSSQEPGTSSTSSQFTGTDVTSKDVHEGTLGVSSSDGKRVTSNRNPNTNAGIFTMQHNATSSTSDKEGKVFGEGNKGDISTENDKKTNNTTEQPSTSSLPQENEDVGSPVDEPQRDTQEMATTAESDNRIGGEMINKKNQEPDNYVPATKGNSKKGKNKGKNVNTQKSRNSNEAEISVHFHVIMSPDVAFDQQKDTFVMKLSPEELGGFSFTSGAGGWVLLKERWVCVTSTLYPNSQYFQRLPDGLLKFGNKRAWFCQESW
ncbi:suppressor protein SRP40 [Lingula anatina]|uniref:Suppressor protein SRP40 n=1 Tax=Lingula anatina TaxID=7574 RepID=A0A1S3IIY8_LINAN|nr:suppressor protein SRP40 [Lingula anatina]|eukprot:XP_013397469.1 suppressor protein SRP40 [Lingula anatina]